jgi:hypothetical protein
MVSREETGGKRTLQVCKTEDSLSIVPESELYEPIAEPADTVVKKDWIRHSASLRAER